MSRHEIRHKEVGRLSRPGVKVEEIVPLGSFKLLRHFGLEEINSGACLPDLAITQWRLYAFILYYICITHLTFTRYPMDIHVFFTLTLV